MIAQLAPRAACSRFGISATSLQVTSDDDAACSVAALRTIPASMSFQASLAQRARCEIGCDRVR
jgi:hypothetical protein